MLTRAQLLERLAALRDEGAKINSIAIDQAEGLPNADVYIRTFGSLYEAYRLIGYCPIPVRGSEVS
jgi:hypothetical protein